MKITEIDWEIRNVYKDTNDNVWAVESTIYGKELRMINNKKFLDRRIVFISDWYTMQDIAEMDFTKVKNALWWLLP